MNTLEHYDRHLGPIYAWMIGDVDGAFSRSTAELRSLELPAPDSPATGTALAVDLGAGIGLHAIALARGGYRLMAIDTCEGLLEQLRLRAQGLPVETVNCDLVQFEARVSGKAAVILCMGDTLTHLADPRSVSDLLQAV